MIKQLEIKNIGIIDDINLEINKPLYLFYGDIKQGKTTILNAIKICFGGAFPKDIVRHGTDEAHIHITFSDSSIRREFYISKEGETVARPIEYISGGRIVKSPVNEIKKLLNPFLLDQNHLLNMNGPDRGRYFAELFGVNTSEHDKEMKELKDDSKELRVVIKTYGEIDITEVKEVDIVAKQEELDKINNDHQKELDDITKTNKEPAAHNLVFDGKKSRLDQLKDEVTILEAWIKANPEQKIEKDPKDPDTSELKLEIQNAAVENLKYKTYSENVLKQAKKTAAEDKVKKNNERIDAISDEKSKKLHEISKKIKIKDLSFNEDGDFIFEKTTSDMLSTSQIMQLSSELSGLYPEGFGLELIDRGESLYKSIFDFVDKAKSNKSTILATVVGEKPAEIPSEIGVFVVEQGNLKE